MKPLIFIIVLLSLCNTVTSQEAKCTDCHAFLKEGDMNVTPEDISKSIHSQKGVSCISCHGKDKFDETKANPHLFTKTFRGVPKRQQEAEFCGICHSLELENFFKSLHYAETKKGTLKGCISCHGYHTVKEPTDNDYINFCVKCHKEDSWEYREGVAFKDSFESRNAELAKLSRNIAGIKDIPGIDITSLEMLKDKFSWQIKMLEKSQHAMEASGVRDELGELSKDINRQYDTVAEKHKSLAKRKIWLSLFIFAILLTIALVNIKFRNANPESQ